MKNIHWLLIILAMSIGLLVMTILQYDPTCRIKPVAPPAPVQERVWGLPG
jgi:hypothetical protein